MSDIPMLTLRNGVQMPCIGVGLYLVDPLHVKELFNKAVLEGYRKFDTASYYKNEKELGDSIGQSSLKRDELFITTKVWNADQGYDQTLEAFDKSMKLLKLDYLDLYLIHWAIPDKFEDTWKALIQLYSDKRVRAIGVSNFQISHLEKLINNSSHYPMLNQIERHPFLSQQELLSFHDEHAITSEAWSPLARFKIPFGEVVSNIAKIHGKTAAQVVLKWHIQRGISIIPKTNSVDRLHENIDIFDFTLTDEEMEKINTLNINKRTGPDPDNVNF